MTQKKLKVPCPTCNKSLIFSTENPFRPFCSERCKLIDLGEWASESRRIPGDQVNKDNDNEDSDG